MIENQQQHDKQIQDLPESAPKKRRVFREILSWLLVVAGGFAAAFIISSFVIVNASVPSGSMMDTIPERSRIVAFRLSYLFSDPQRFDVVVFRYPGDNTTYYVKRIVGMPGDTLQIMAGTVYINGEAIYEEYVRGEPSPFDNHGPFLVPEGAFFVLGDNRNNSDDSRRWQDPFVGQEKIVGRVVFSYFPTVRAIR